MDNFSVLFLKHQIFVGTSFYLFVNCIFVSQFQTNIQSYNYLLFVNVEYCFPFTLLQIYSLMMILFINKSLNVQCETKNLNIQLFLFVCV